MRIAMILPHWHYGPEVEAGLPARSGLHRVVFQLSSALARSCEVTLITFGEVRQSMDFEPRFRVEVFPAVRLFQSINRNNDPVSFKWLRELKDFNIVHAHQVAADSSLLAMLVARATGKAAFITDYGWNGLSFGRYRAAARFADGVLLLSSFEIGLYRQYNRNISVISCGVDSSWFTPGDNGKDDNVVLFVGRIEPHKGIHHLIAALPPGCELRVVGDTFDERFAESLHRQASGKKVLFLGRVDDISLRTEYRRASVCVLPSTYFDYYGRFRRFPELFGLVLAEAMACATPVVCTWVGGMPEVVEHGVTGLIVPPEDESALRDALLSILDNKQKARNMGLAGRKRVEEYYTWDKVANRCIEAYNRFG